MRGVMSVIDAPCILAEAMKNAAANLTRAGERLVRMLLPVDPREAGLRHAVVRLHESGAVCVIARPGDTPRLLHGSGIAPIVHALRADRDAFAGCAAADKIVGLAAAYLFTYGRAAAIHGDVMSAAAERWMSKQGIPHSAGEVVEKIINRRGDGICPMEARALQLTSPEEAWAVFDEMIQ